MYKVAKLLQVLGMVMLPVGLFYGIEHRDEKGAIATELLFVAAGAALFILGRFLEGRAAR